MSNTTPNQFVLASAVEVWADRGVSADFLKSMRLFKTHSLLVARTAGVKVPSSLLLLDRRPDLIANFAQSCGSALMIRVDYQQSPIEKPLGGVPLYTLKAMYGVCEYLFKRKC